ncbi:hypothetical protein [Pseudomaricurvus sp. HS19]|uniref:hypothetical protein n=1 Tax=Pseudomaricurvus sp. HS19 TaxID=2692626 RepID=UPI001371F7DE|nr:hypothetical protein [Pseudomaricurvus sp. HS19]MYM64126.1 hypothetical protein [Pseudomaricurvus sp. HS19]
MFTDPYSPQKFDRRLERVVPVHAVQKQVELPVSETRDWLVIKAESLLEAETVAAGVVVLTYDWADAHDSMHKRTSTGSLLLDFVPGRVARADNRHAWLEKFYLDAARATKAADIYPLVSGVKGLFSKKAYKDVDDILLSAPLGKFSVLSLLTLVRTTYPAKSKLGNWSACLERVRALLKEKGEDPAKLLRGLD